MRVSSALSAAVAVAMITLIGGTLPTDGHRPVMVATAADYAAETADPSPAGAASAAEPDAAPSALPTNASTPGTSTPGTNSADDGFLSADDADAGSTPCSSRTNVSPGGTAGAPADPARDDAAVLGSTADGPLDAAVPDIRDLLRRILGNADAPASAPVGTASAVLPVPGASPTISPVPTAATPDSRRAELPADVLKLTDWHLTLPTGKQGAPDTVENPTLEKFTNEFFKLNPERDGVVFSARGDGVTTKNSHYPRSELREMDGSAKASWTNTTGSHTLDVCEAITKVPTAKPEVVSAQIHDDHDDVLQIRLEGQKLMVQYNDGKSEAVLDPAYTLGTPFDVRIVAADSKVDICYNGQHKAKLPLSGSGWYWKVGAYVQSNATKGDGAGSEGEVVVYSLNAMHDSGPGGSTGTAPPRTTTDARSPVLSNGATR